MELQAALPRLNWATVITESAGAAKATKALVYLGAEAATEAAAASAV